jgi:multidrug efflux pump subunit AcrB
LPVLRPGLATKGSPTLQLIGKVEGPPPCTPPTNRRGFFFITLKPKSERDVSAGEVIARLRPQLEKVEGARLFLQAAQDVNIGGRIARTLFLYTLQDAVRTPDQ